MEDQNLLPLLAALVGALAGALLGVWSGQLELRRRYAFERRLGWCEDMIKCVVSAGYLATAYSEQQSSAGSNVLWDELICQYKRLIPLCNQKQVYASRQAVDAIDAFMTALNEIIRLSLEQRKSGSHATNAEIPQSCLEELQAAADLVARDARRHLGWPRLRKQTPGRHAVFVGSLHAEILALEATASSAESARPDQGSNSGS